MAKRNLRKGISKNIKTDNEFERSRKVLASKRKQLTQQGKGNKPKLYDFDYFGIKTPLSLQRTMWWKLTMSFGYRARDEARKLQFGDVKLCTDESGRQYLEWDKERGTKIRTGKRTHRDQGFHGHLQIHTF